MAKNDSAAEPYRRWGYLEARIDPLGRLGPVRPPELEAVGPEGEPYRRIYCGSVGAEFMHLPDARRRQWIGERMEREPSPIDPDRILELLIQGDVFERVLQRRYLGTKRYSLEGALSLLPLLSTLLEPAPHDPMRECILGMTHRGRMNVMANILGISWVEMFAEFEDIDPASVLGGGDVKYHLGARGAYPGAGGASTPILLVPNPSHLEAVDPVVVGLTRAAQDFEGDLGRDHVRSIMVHGDAAFAGQGMLSETLNLSGLEGFTVGGTIHVLVNNLIGFTTHPAALHTSRYASDAAKRLPIPVFHVNGEDPAAVVRAARLAREYSREFRSDVVLDMICYRRHGHSEVEDPSVTQPLLYRQIERREPVWQLFARDQGREAGRLKESVERIEERFLNAQEQAKSLTRRPRLFSPSAAWSGHHGGLHSTAEAVLTRLPAERLQAAFQELVRIPADFHPHPKIEKFLSARRTMARGEQPVDWSTAEALAFGALRAEGFRVRLSGQDSRRGTFNQRHAVLIDVENGREFCPLAQSAGGEGCFECIDSPLSEASIVGFEYGYSLHSPRSLVLWEAQFGDFANGAQVILDQYLSAAEDKWGVLSGLVLLLPHGYEGQGPEHSSARMERFLQLAAEDNWQVCQPSNAAQYFHLLRRQAIRLWRKPLVVFTPKSLLRHPSTASPLSEFSEGSFQPVLSRGDAAQAESLVFCTGKVFHGLSGELDRGHHPGARVVSLEELYPFPEKELAALLDQNPSARELVWVQEEPANMGALEYVLPRLRELAGPRTLRSVKRTASASPATGSFKAHEMEQSVLRSMAFLPHPPREGEPAPDPPPLPPRRDLR
jgi:2-oxoglutarate dehydrogenase E1 component